jgi:hypothetical protein
MMSINKANLKKLLMPVVKECVKEALADKSLLQEIVLSSGVLSNVVKEVADGLNYAQQSSGYMERERYSAHLNASATRVPSAVQEARVRREEFRQQAAILPMSKPSPKKPTTEFEKTQSQVDASYNKSASRHGALAGSDPDDSGINLANFGFGGSINESKRPNPNDEGVDLAQLMGGSRR